MRPPTTTMRVGAAMIAMLVLPACDNMQHQENARLPPPHTVSRSAPGPDEAIATGMRGGRWMADFPVPLTRDFVIRGGERYGIFCSECHGADGSGRGIVVARGFPQPPSFHTARARNESPGELFWAITHGSGVMYGFADRIAPADRWAIAGYIRALQRSRNATLADVPERDRVHLAER
jgi:cytochrome c553